MSAMGFEIMLGSLTTTGSLIAFGKLQGLVPGKPLVYRGQNIFNMTLLATTVGLFIYLIFVPTAVIPFYVMLGLARVRRPARDADRLSRHAGGDVFAEFV